MSFKIFKNFQYTLKNQTWVETEEIKDGIFDFEKGLLGPNLVLVDQMCGNIGARHYYEDPIFVHIPFSNFSGINGKSILIKGDIYNCTIGVFGLDRLHEIRQFTHLPYYNPKSDMDERMIVGCPTHSRFYHTITSAVMLEIWMRKQGHYSEEIINFGILMALLHDAATSAFGDMMKYFYYADYDEEKNLRLYISGLDQNIVKNFCIKYGIDLEKVLALFERKFNEVSPELSRLYYFFSKVVDRLSYTALDFSRVRPETESLYEFELPELRFKDCNFADCYLNFYFDGNGKLICKNNREVYWFLLIRSLMARYFYFNPLGRSVEIYIAYRFKRFMEYVTKTELVRKTECEILRLISSRVRKKDKKELQEFNCLIDNLSMGYIEMIIFEKMINSKHELEDKKLKLINEQKIKFHSGLSLFIENDGLILEISETKHHFVEFIRNNEAVIEQPIYYYLRI